MQNNDDDKDYVDVINHYNTNVEMIIFKFGLKFLLLVAAMWVVNAFIKHPGLNLVPFFIGALFIFVKGFSPVAILSALGLGGVVAGLGDADITQGSLRGVAVLAKVVWGAMFGFLMIAGVLATWPFAPYPWNFWPAAAAVMTIAVMFVYFDISTGGVLRLIVLLYCISVIILNVFWAPLANWVEDTTGIQIRELSEEEKKDRKEQERQQEIEEARHQANLRAAATPPPAPPLTRSVVVPACRADDTSWVEIDIPPGWNITLPWNLAAARYQWRAADREWVEENNPPPPADKVRACAVQREYAGDTMNLTWTRRL